MQHEDSSERAFYRRQAKQLLELARLSHDPATAQMLTSAARYYLDRLDELPSAAAA